MYLWVQAFLYGTLSAASLPLGAILGYYNAPVKGEIVAGMLAFGSGALLFAVTVELYGQALSELHRWGRHMAVVEIMVTIVGALLGALAFLYLNLWLDEYMNQEAELPEDLEKAGEGSKSRDEDPAFGSEDSGVSDPAKKTSKRVTLADDSLNEYDTFERTATCPALSAPSEATPLLKFKSAVNRLKMVSVVGARRQSHFTTAVAIAKLPVAIQHSTSIAKSGAHGKDDAEAKASKDKGLQVALAVFLGVLADGVPEAILMGLLAAQSLLSFVLVAALFVANFPEAFSSASLMAESDVGAITTIGSWTGLCLLTGVLSGISCGIVQLAAPDGHLSQNAEFVAAFIEGLAGGAMIACISAVMLPEAFERAAKKPPYFSSGFLCTAGFLVSVAMKVLGGDVNDVEDQVESTVKHFFF